MISLVKRAIGSHQPPATTTLGGDAGAGGDRVAELRGHGLLSTAQCARICTHYMGVFNLAAAVRRSSCPANRADEQIVASESKTKKVLDHTRSGIHNRAKHRTKIASTTEQTILF